MDPTLQQTASGPEAMDEISVVNGGEDFNNAAPAPAASNGNDNVPEPPTYDDLFPSLPTSGNEKGNTGGANPMDAWSKKPTLLSSTVTQVFNIPMEERRNPDGQGFGADDKHKTLRLIMDRTACKIEMSSSKDQSLTFLLQGKQEAVLRARRELLTHFQTQATSTISISKDHHRFILGRGGQKLQQLEQNTATKISIPKTNDPSDVITISGPKEGIDKAIHEIQIVSDEQSKQAYEVLGVPKIYHPFINGPNGDLARQMVADLPNVRINIPPLSVMKDELSIAGEKDGVLKVKDKVLKIWKEMETKSTTVSVEVRKSQHKYVIGPKGNSINEILADTGVFVEMPGTESTSETITLRGPPEKLGLALTKVYEKANSVVSYDVSCPTWLHKYIIGKKGANIQKLTCDLPKVHVEFLDSGDKIKIEGPPDEVEKARELLEGQARDLEKNTAYAEIAVDAKYHKHIIGKGGSTVNKIKQESDVMINIPDIEFGSAKIRIEGNKNGVKRAREELEDLIKKMENEREKDLIIENRFHRQLIGPKGENIQRIRDDFASVQISFPDLGVQSDIVKLRGPKDDVEKCSKVLNKLYKELLEANYQVKVQIFRQFHKFIIGKGGVTIRKIREETDTKVDLPASGSDSDTITITGRKENVEKAQKKIQQIQAEMANVVSVDITIPHKIHNTMIGAGGKLIQSIMDDCGGVSIKFPPAESKSDKVTIRGPKDDVEKAKKMMTELSNEKQLSSISAEVRAKPEHHKFLIGRQGANIQSIRDKTGARIIFPGENDKDREIIAIIGTKEAVAAAKKELEQRIKDLDNIVEDTMVVDPKFHRHFVARRGEILRNIGDEYGGVVVSFPRSGVTSDKVTLKGAKGCVEAAKNRILSIVSDLESQVTEDCVIEQQYHRTVMGARGSKVQKICADFEVQIKFPDKASANGEVKANGESEVGANNIIKVSGRKENVEGACKALQALVPVNAEIDVPFEYHRFIIGQKGGGVRNLMNDFDVNIKVPPPDNNSNTIIVSGAPSNVKDLEAELMRRVEGWDEEKRERELKNFEIKIEVNPEYHPKIIGRRGAVIQDLRQKHDVNIQLPKKGAPDEHIITITGYEKDAEAAKQSILNIVGEFESMIKEEVMIDHRVHAMIIGRRGAGIRKIMNDFKVDIKLPRDGDQDPDLVTIMGQEDNVLDCKDHLLNLTEEYMQDIQDREWMDEYMKPSSKSEETKSNKNNNKGFELKGAPWQGNSDEAFPTLGGGPGAGSNTQAPSLAAGVWASRR